MTRTWASILLISAALSARAGEGKPCAPCPWAGIFPTVLTPFCDGGVDVASLEKQLQHELHGGVHGLLLLGTIGEGQYVSMSERAQVIVTAVRAACHKMPVVVGIHTCEFSEAEAQMQQAKELGADAVLVKYIGHPDASFGQVHGFYAALAGLRCLPIFYYHYPSQTGLQLAPREIAYILGLDGVVGIKESTLNLKEVAAHLCLTKGQGKVFLSGSALNLTQFLELGGHGAMCPEAVLMPGPTVQAYTAYIHGRCEEARSMQKEFFVVLPILNGSMIPEFAARTFFMTAEDHKLPVPMGNSHPQARLKAALGCIGIPISPAVKCPLPPLSQHDLDKVKSAVCKMKQIDWCEAALSVPPVPLHACTCDENGGMLLRTGAFQLGPDVGKDLLRSQGDGLSGFSDEGP